MNDERKIEKISISKIVPNIYQPRLVFNEKSMLELIESIKNYGIIQPIILRKNNDKYEIIDGERRYKAAKKIGLETVPSIVLNLEEKEIAELILNENIQKQLLNPIEEANAYQQIMLINKISLNDLSKKIGKDIQSIEGKLKLLELSTIVQEGLLNNKISETHARILTKIKNKKNQEKLYYQIITERLTVKSLENIIDNELSQEEKKENKEMNNQFNLYDNLMKEKETQQMSNSEVSQPILNNTNTVLQQNDFFPSLEEQPLNMNFSNNFNELNNLSQMQSPMTQNVQQPVGSQESNISVSVVPQFENNSDAIVQMTPVTSTVQQPVEQHENIMPTPPLPTFNNISVMTQPNPVMPSMQQSIEQHESIAPTPSLPQFENNSDVIEKISPSVTQEIPKNEILEKKDMSLAINLIKDIIPLLEKCGYKILTEEQDSNTEYELKFKIQK